MALVGWEVMGVPIFGVSQEVAVVGRVARRLPLMGQLQQMVCNYGDMSLEVPVL